jgi:hypothetical protein
MSKIKKGAQLNGVQCSVILSGFVIRSTKAKNNSLIGFLFFFSELFALFV